MTQTSFLFLSILISAFINTTQGTEKQIVPTQSPPPEKSLKPREKSLPLVPIPRINIEQREIQKITPEQLASGGNLEPAYIVPNEREKTTTTGISTREKCYQFVTQTGDIFSPCYSTKDLSIQLNNTKGIYENAKIKLIDNAYRSLEPFIKDIVDRDTVNSIINNYFNTEFRQNDIDITGSSLPEDEKQNIKNYMKMCEAIYTDQYTRAYFNDQKISGLQELLNPIISRYIALTNLEKLYLTITKDIRDINELSSVQTDVISTQMGTEKRNVAPINKKLLYESAEIKYNQFLERLKEFLLNNWASRKIISFDCIEILQGIKSKGNAQIIGDILDHSIERLKSGKITSYSKFMEQITKEISDKIGQPAVPFDLNPYEQYARKHQLGMNLSGLENANTAYQELLKFKPSIDEEFSLYFEADEKQSKEWKVSFTKMSEWVSSKFFGSDFSIPYYKYDGEHSYQYSPKGVVIISFLMQTGLIANPNITVLDVGFRNNEEYGSILNKITTTLMSMKRNLLANFTSWGEVDHISLIEADPKQQKDKLIIAYAGSNSQMDWGIDFTIGTIQVESGLAVHAGIGWLFDTSIKTFHSTLMQRILQYYKINPKPKELEVDITGHSLGGGLAELSAHYYKTIASPDIKKQTGIPKINVKAYTYAAPAIVDEKSKEKYERDLDTDNVKRVWVTNDPVPVVSQAIGIQGGKHVGENIPLFNINEIRKDWSDLWGPHGAKYYLSLINNLLGVNPGKNQQLLMDSLGNYISVNHLDTIKLNLMLINYIENQLRQNNLPIQLTKGLADQVIKYTSEKSQYIPPLTIGEFNPDSPRSLGYPSPRYEVDRGAPNIEKLAPGILRTGKDIFSIDVVVKIKGQEHDENLVASTDCSKDAVKSRLTKSFPGLITDAEVEPISCGLCVAKRIFVSQYPKEVTSTYYGILGYATEHQDTLTKIFDKCIEEKACTTAYLAETSKGRSPIKQASHILKVVGLEEDYNQQKIYFDKMEVQDQQYRKRKQYDPNWERPGKFVENDFYKSKVQDTIPSVIITYFLSDNPKDQESIPSEVKDHEALFLKLIEAINQKNRNEIRVILNIGTLKTMLLEMTQNKDGSINKETYDTLRNRYIDNLMIIIEKISSNKGALKFDEKSKTFLKGVINSSFDTIFNEYNVTVINERSPLIEEVFESEGKSSQNYPALPAPGDDKRILDQ